MEIINSKEIKKRGKKLEFDFSNFDVTEININNTNIPYKREWYVIGSPYKWLLGWLFSLIIDWTTEIYKWESSHIQEKIDRLVRETLKENKLIEWYPKKLLLELYDNKNTYLSIEFNIISLKYPHISYTLEFKEDSWYQSYKSYTFEEWRELMKWINKYIWIADDYITLHTGNKKERPFFQLYKKYWRKFWQLTYWWKWIQNFIKDINSCILQGKKDKKLTDTMPLYIEWLDVVMNKINAWWIDDFERIRIDDKEIYCKEWEDRYLETLYLILCWLRYTYYNWPIPPKYYDYFYDVDYSNEEDYKAYEYENNSKTYKYSLDKIIKNVWDNYWIRSIREENR